MTEIDKYKLTMSRAYTKEEVRDQFLNHVRGLIDYWSARPDSTKECVEGVAFSILAALDGGSGLPAFYVVASPHPSDRDFNKSLGENYYPSASLMNDIAGDLHERLFKQ